MAAIRYEHEGIVEMFIESGADVMRTVFDPTPHAHAPNRHKDQGSHTTACFICCRDAFWFC
eukprot:44899-Prymnesium_polylepis.1